MENKNQPVIITKTSNSGYLKWLLGLGAVGAAWFMFSSFKGKQEETLPDPDSVPDDSHEVTHGEQYEIDLWKYGILKSGKAWPTQIAARAKEAGKSFTAMLNDVAVAKYVEKGPNSGKIEEYFQNAIRRKEIKMRQQGAAYMKKVSDKAVEKGISLEQQMERTAIWGILNDLIKPWLANQPHPNPNPHPHYNGIGAVRGVSI